MVEIAVNRAGFYIKNRNSLVFIPFEEYPKLQELLDEKVKNNENAKI